MSTQLNWVKISAGSYSATFATREYTVEKAHKGRKWFLCQSLNPLPLEFTTLKAAQEFAQRSNDLYIGSFQALAKSEPKGVSTFLVWSVFAFQMESINWGINNAIHNVVPQGSFEGWQYVHNLAYFSTCVGAYYVKWFERSNWRERTTISFPGWFNWRNSHKNALEALEALEKSLTGEHTLHMADRAESKSLSTESAALKTQEIDAIAIIARNHAEKASGTSKYLSVSSLAEVIEASARISKLKALCIVSSVARWSLLCHYLNCIYLAVNLAIKDLRDRHWFPFQDWERFMANFYTYSKVSLNFCNATNRPYHWIDPVVSPDWVKQVIENVDCLIQSWDAVYQAAPEIVEREWGHN